MMATALGAENASTANRLGMKTNFRTYIGILFLLLYPCCISFASTVDEYSLSVTLRPENHLLEGRADIVMKQPGPGPVVLMLNPSAELLGVGANGRRAEFRFERGTVLVDATGVKADDPLRLSIEYRCRFAQRPPSRRYAGDNPSSGVEGMIGEEGTFLLPGAEWYPRIPGAKLPLILTVKAPEGEEAVTAGERVSRTTADGVTISVWRIVPETDGIGLSAGKYVVGEKKADGIPVFTYFFPDDARLSEAYLEAAGRYLLMYENLFGRYAFPKFAVVENFLPTGYGFPSYTLLGATVIRLPFILDTSLGHEVAHCWWGNGVLVDYSRGNWSEGLTTYVADHYYQELSSPAKAAEYRLKILRDYAALVTPDKDFPLREFVARTDPVTSAVGYGKAAMVFHMVRKRIGDQAFWDGLRDVFGQKLFQEASWDDFAAAFGRRAGEDLGSFFHQWVDRTGAPLLSLQSVKAERTDDGWHVTGMLVQPPPAFDVEVPVKVETVSGGHEEKVRIRGEREPFSFSLKEAPLRLVADPDADVFRRLHSEEMVPIVNSVRGAGALTVVRAENMVPALDEQCSILLESLGQGGATVVPESKVTPTDLAGKDVFFAGLPRRTDLLSATPMELQLGSLGFSIGGKDYHDDADCLFAVVRNPADPKRIAAIFLPLSEQAAAAVVPKIMHYGKYSYLVFRNGKNVEKGIWPVRRSPLIHVFKEE